MTYMLMRLPPESPLNKDLEETKYIRIELPLSGNGSQLDSSAKLSNWCWLLTYILKKELKNNGMFILPWYEDHLEKKKCNFTKTFALVYCEKIL